ncbi:MAG: helix-turn-helix transcriptional regulator [Deltaproteobacteria bacterium]|jgi:transcriptional regulator with XRE-family HTH domain|nr:helix-turn-helix transcriptional regulator [Deltaproteobacteria bacterium]
MADSGKTRALSTNRVFPERLRQRRLDLGLTLKEVSDSIGKTLNAVSFYERGDRQPRLSDLVALAKALSCDPAWLLGVKEEPESLEFSLPQWVRPILKKLVQVKVPSDRQAIKKLVFTSASKK